MTDKVQISFEGSGDDAMPPMVIIHNSEVLSAGLARQIARYGITRRSGNPGQVSGYLQGARKDFLAMVQSYGVGIEIIRRQPPAATSTFE
jgi:hypothetical protein